MAPQCPEHSHSISTQTTRFVRFFGDSHYVRVQQPIDLGHSQLEPDFSLVPMGGESSSRLPTTADLVIEIAKTSLSFDRNEKASLYAKAGIPELWILNIDARQVEVYRKPAIMAGSIYGYGYASIELLKGEDKLSPLFFPTAIFTAAELLG